MGVTYNNYPFSEKSHVEISANPVYDAADRTVIYWRHILRVNATIVPQLSIDPNPDPNQPDTMTFIRKALSEVAGVLVLEDIGWGDDVTINGYSSAVKDVNFGPKPRMLQWTPVGNNLAAEVVWECEFCIPVCGLNYPSRHTGLASFNYAVNYSISPKGYTTRTISGHLIIAQTRGAAGDDTVLDTADEYRDLIDVPRLLSYHRTQTYDLSSDRNRLNFTITDAQIESPNAYPPGVINIDARQRSGWRRAKSQTLPVTLSCKIELAPKTDRTLAWDIMKAIFLKRIEYAKTNLYPIFLVGLEMDENLFGNDISFTLSWYVLAGLEDMFLVSGAFQALPYNWEAWHYSMEENQNNRGISGLVHTTGEDAIVDLCTLNEPSIQQQEPSYPPYSAGPPRLCNDPPDPEKSWVYFRATLTRESNDEVLVQSTLGRPELIRVDFDPANPLGEVGGIEPGDIKTIISQGQSVEWWWWRGTAVRVGYEIPEIDKITIGGKDTKKASYHRWTMDKVGVFFCQPVYQAVWEMKFWIPEKPDKPFDDLDRPFMRRTT